MKDDATETPLTLTDEQIVTRRRALGLAVAAVGATALAGRAAYADDDTEGEVEDEQDITEGDPDAAESDSDEMDGDSSAEGESDTGEGDPDSAESESDSDG